MNMIRCSQIPHPTTALASPLGQPQPEPTPKAPADLAPTASKRRTETIETFHKKENPTLLIHVGPTHTHANELKDDLRAISLDLARDKIVLADRTSEKVLTNLECHKSLHQARREFAKKQEAGKLPQNASNLKDYLVATVPCWKHANVVLDLHKERGESLIIVDEQLSKRNFDFEDLWLAPLDLIALETLSEDWNIELVVGYRRFSEWLPDVVEEYSQKRHMLNDASWKPPEPMFPDIVKGVGQGSLARINATYTNTLVDRYSYRKTGVAKIPVTVLNVHAAGSLGKTLACTILRAAKQACGAAKTHRSLLAHNKDQPQGLPPAQLSDFYGLIVSDAGKRSAYRKKAASPEVAEIAVKYYQETVLGKSAKDLPMACPQKGELRGLLQQSLEYEKKLLPGFAQKSREEHKKSFWAASKASPQRLCQVDMRKILHTKDWRLYLRKIPSKVPKALLPRNFVQQQLQKHKNKSVIRGGKFLGMITTLRRKKSKS